MAKITDAFGWRVLRKSAHLSNKTVKKGSNFLDRVENKTTRIITNKIGSPDATASIGVDDFIYRAFPEITPVHPALPTIGQRPSITVFAFLDPRGFYGGIATTLFVGATLANRLGYDLRVAQTANFSKKTDVVLKFLQDNGITIEPERFSAVDLSKRNPHNFGYLPLHPDDVVVVSAWWDAHIAAQLPLKRKFVYLIQDYEPIFYNNSDLSVLANQTYFTEKFQPLCNTEILYKYFKAGGYDYISKNAGWFEPAPAPKLPPRTEAADPNATRKLFLYGRPHVHRNLFYNAIRALDIAFDDERVRSQNWELFCAGSPDVPSIKLQSGHVIKNMGKMDLDKYYEFARGMDVAVSPMLAPHPNYPTLELAALGAMVVSTKWQTKQDLSFYSPNILMAEPTPKSMAEKIIEAACARDDTRRKGLKKNAIGSDWPAALKAPIDTLAALYKIDT